MGNRDKIALAGGGLVLANLAQNIFGSTFSGLGGLSLWVPFALAIGPLTPLLRYPAAGPASENRAVSVLSG